MRSARCWTVWISLAAALAAPATAGVRVENQLAGSVLSVQGNAQGALAALGVSDGANVSVVFGVDAGTPGVGVPQGTQYLNPLTDLTIQIGSFEATLNAGQLHQVIVTNDVDVYSVSAFVDATDDVLGLGANALMLLSEFGNGAIDNENLAQDLSRFDTGTVAISGLDATVSILLDLEGFGGGGGSLRSCLPGLLSAGGAYCQAVVQCLGKFPVGADLDACIDKASDRFVGKFDQATDRSDVCPAVVDGLGAVAGLGDDVDPLDALIRTGADPDSKDDAKYRRAFYKNAAKALGKGLKVYAKDAKKPDAEKLERALTKLEAKLAAALAKAESKADGKGVTTDIDPQAVIDEVFELIDSVRALSNGL